MKQCKAGPGCTCHRSAQDVDTEEAEVRGGRGGRGRVSPRGRGRMGPRGRRPGYVGGPRVGRGDRRPRPIWPPWPRWGWWQGPPTPHWAAPLDDSDAPASDDFNPDLDPGDEPADETRARPVPHAQCAHVPVHSLLPARGPGYYAAGPAGNRFGRAALVRAVAMLGRLWRERFPGAPRLGIGALSPRCGGRPHRHGGHQLGLDVDIRPLRNDGTEVGVDVRSPGYSRQLTQALVDLLRSTPALGVEGVVFSDPAIRGITVRPGHEDHLHVRLVGRPAGQR
jgi:Penicillin-insensitive murein endopeptidase